MLKRWWQELRAVWNFICAMERYREGDLEGFIEQAEEWP